MEPEPELATAPRSRRRSKRLPQLKELAAYLQSQLGRDVTALLSGVSDPRTVGRWVAGKTVPPHTREHRLRCAYDATRLIVERVGKDSARAWFLASSPFLGDAAPALVLHDSQSLLDCRDVLPAARSFVEGAY